MKNEKRDDGELFERMERYFKPHPWHGLDPWSDKENKILNVFIEMAPEDTVKYEFDKKSGYLKVDRPQKYSNIVPSLYGFLPRTYCGDKTADYSAKATGRSGLKGDGDPLDICVLTEKRIVRGDLLLDAVPVGGLRMIDRGEVDDKIIAVLKNDLVFGDFRDIEELPKGIVSRLKHYFLTYKQIPSGKRAIAEITHAYGAREALEVIELSEKDYEGKF